MSVRGVSHLAIGVRDMERSLAFFRDVIGLAIAVDQEEPASATWGSGRRRAVYLRWAHGDDTTFLVLDQALDAPTAGKPKALFEVGTHHYGFWVDDVEAIVARADAAGARVWVRPKTADTKGYGEASGRQVKVALLYDPDGNVVQLDQRM
jgi:catechol 2,3-dioxygenase-like lactoylglutathione lyase family enzyme